MVGFSQVADQEQVWAEGRISTAIPPASISQPDPETPRRCSATLRPSSRPNCTLPLPAAAGSGRSRRPEPKSRGPKAAASVAIPSRMSDRAVAGVILIDAAGVFGVVPTPRIALPVGWRACKLILVEIHDVAALVGIIMQNRPGQGMVVLAHAEEPAERHDSVRPRQRHKERFVTSSWDSPDEVVGSAQNFCSSRMFLGLAQANHHPAMHQEAATSMALE